MLLLATARVSRPQIFQISSRAISVKSILHGSPEAKELGEIERLQHSKIVGRGKYIHALETHRVPPSKAEAYKKAAETYYLGLKDDPELHVKLTGNWETIIGPQDTFSHILEHEHFGGYDKATALIKNSKVHSEAYKDMLAHVESRHLQLCSEFAFLPTEPPHTEGGIFELRSYQLKPGTLLEWENTWRKGIEARRKFVSPVGAWFSQVGRLHQVHHLWQYPSLEARKELREAAWQTDGWAETVSKTSQLAKVMDTFILEALPFSPLR